MTFSPWTVLSEGCTGASEAVIVAPYMKVKPLAMVLDRLQAGASIVCFTRWTPQDIRAGVSDTGSRTLVVERGGSFRLNNRLHAKYYRFDDQVLIGSANMTGSGLNYPHYGNLEILCKPGESFSPRVFEAQVERGSMEVSDDDFEMWQQVVDDSEPHVSLPETEESDFNGWRPQTRTPSYLWHCYKGEVSLIGSDEQIVRARSDLRALGVPSGLTKQPFCDWIRLCLQASPFVEFVGRHGGQEEPLIWDLVADEWHVNRATAARWVSTTHNWLRYFNRSAARLP